MSSSIDFLAGNPGSFEVSTFFPSSSLLFLESEKVEKISYIYYLHVKLSWHRWYDDVGVCDQPEFPARWPYPITTFILRVALDLEFFTSALGALTLRFFDLR